MPRNSVALGPTVGLPSVYLPPASNDATIATSRAAYRAVVAATERIIPTVATAGHPISESFSATTRELIRTQS